MPKDRNIAHLLEMVERVSQSLTEAYDTQQLVRREIYPEVPPEGRRNIQAEDSRYRVGAFLTKPDPEDTHVFLVINFGYCDHLGKVTDNWSNDMYTGPEDKRFWDRVNYKKTVSPYPGNDMERLAYEGAWRNYVDTSPRSSALALEHFRLDNLTRKLHSRKWTLIAGVQRIIEAELRQREVNRWSGNVGYGHDRKVGPAILLDGKIPCYFEGERLVFGEITDTFVVATTATLPETDRNFGYGEGSNASLKNRIWQRKRAKDERAKRNER